MVKNIVKKHFKFLIEIRSKLRLLIRVIKCNKIKRKMIKLIPNIKSLSAENEKKPKYIVSLTSYNTRLTKTAPYAIISLLNQSIKPDKIILWIAYEDKVKVPKIMNLLIEKGLEIRYCEDLKPYKKLIPALQAFPNDYIITADDDLYFPFNWFEKILEVHKQNPRKIICNKVTAIKIDKNYNPLPFNKWDLKIDPVKYFTPDQPFHKLESIHPMNGVGTLFPPNCFYKDILNKELFMKLAPLADDIWFWAMAVINKDYFKDEPPYIVLPSGDHNNFGYIDPLEGINGKALWNFNSQGGNDKQLNAIIDHYPQIKDIFHKLIPS